MSEKTYDRILKKIRNLETKKVVASAFFIILMFLPFAIAIFGNEYENVTLMALICFLVCCCFQAFCLYVIHRIEDMIEVLENKISDYFDDKEHREIF